MFPETKLDERKWHFKKSGSFLAAGASLERLWLLVHFSQEYEKLSFTSLVCEHFPCHPSPIYSWENYA